MFRKHGENLCAHIGAVARFARRKVWGAGARRYDKPPIVTGFEFVPADIATEPLAGLAAIPLKPAILFGCDLRLL